MECHKCGTPIPPGEERSYHDIILCEDCYMDVLSPARACDPWAVRSAGLSARSGDSLEGSAVQQRILSLIRENNGMSIDDLAERLALKTGDVEREIAALRHMEKVRATLRDGNKIIIPW